MRPALTLAARPTRPGPSGRPGGVVTALLLLLRSAASPRAIELFREDLDRTQLRALAARLGGDGAEARAALVFAQLAGFAILRHVLRPAALADAPVDELVALLSRSLSSIIDAT